MVAQRSLEPLVQVRILVGQPKDFPSKTAKWFDQDAACLGPLDQLYLFKFAFFLRNLAEMLNETAVETVTLTKQLRLLTVALLVLAIVQRLTLFRG